MISSRFKEGKESSGNGRKGEGEDEDLDADIDVDVERGKPSAYPPAGS